MEIIHFVELVFKCEVRDIVDILSLNSQNINRFWEKRVNNNKFFTTI